MRKSKQMNFNKIVNLILEQTQTYANKGIVFRGNTGCCIGVEHGKGIELSQDLIERIKKIPNLKFFGNLALSIQSLRVGNN